MRGADVHEVRGLGHRGGLRQPLVGVDVLVEELHEVQGDVVEHDRRDHLVEPAGDLQEAREQRPQAAEHDAGDEGDEHGGHTREAEGDHDVGGRGGAHDELALAAQVEDAALIREDRGERREDERAGALERLADLVDVAQRALQHGAVALDGVLAQARDDDRAHDEGKKDRDDRREDREHLLALLLGGELSFCVCHCSSPPTFRPWRARSP